MHVRFDRRTPKQIHYPQFSSAWTLNAFLFLSDLRLCLTIAVQNNLSFYHNELFQKNVLTENDDTTEFPFDWRPLIPGIVRNVLEEMRIQR